MKITADDNRFKIDPDKKRSTNMKTKNGSTDKPSVARRKRIVKKAVEATKERVSQLGLPARPIDKRLEADAVINANREKQLEEMRKRQQRLSDRADRMAGKTISK